MNNKILLKLKCWALVLLAVCVLTNVLFFAVFKPPKQTDFEYFQICTLQDGVAIVTSLQDYNQAPERYRLCQHDVEYTPAPTDSNGNVYPLTFQRIEVRPKWFQWQLTQMTGGPADPNYYRYEMSGHQITPLWHQHGNYFTYFLSVFCSLFIVWASYEGYKIFLKFKHKGKGKGNDHNFDG